MVKKVQTRVPVIQSLAVASSFSGGSHHACSLAKRKKSIHGAPACDSGARNSPQSRAFPMPGYTL